MSPLSVVLIVLLVVWACLLFGGYFFGRADAKAGRRMPTWTRIGSSLVLVLAAWLFVLLAQGSSFAPFTRLIALGMTLGFAGDLFMAGLAPVSQPVLFGMSAFGAGHVAYIAAQFRLAAILGLPFAGLILAAWLLWLLVAATAWYLVVFRGHRATPLHWAALPYSLLLASTAGIATGLALQDARLIPLALGAILFLFSDFLIAVKLFAARTSKGIDDLIWLTYGPGQCLIVYTTASLLLLPG